MTARRIVRVPISCDLWTEILTTGWQVPDKDNRIIKCIDGLPEGAKLIHSAYDIPTAVEYLFFEHESFEPVEPQAVVPLKLIHWQYETKE